MSDNNNDKLPKINEAKELEHLWKNYVISQRGQRIRKICLTAVAVILIVGALFVEDELAWHAVAVVVEVVNHTLDDVLDALGVERD
jgi:hypothetical protein